VIERLRGLEVLMLSALLQGPHPLHLSVPEAVAAAQQIAARRTFLIHLTHETRSEEHTSELQSLAYLVCRLLLEKKKKIQTITIAKHTRRESAAFPVTS